VKTLIARSLLVVLALSAASTAHAQTPRPDSAAVGGDVGLFIPAAENMKTGPTLEGFYEYYPTARTSIRLGLGWADPKRDTEDDDSIRFIRVGGDFVYNWEGGTVHPFVGGGLGVYFLQERDNGENLGDAETKLGATLFGGVELFTSNTVSFKAEAKYHLIDNPGTYNPDGLALTVGIKKYF
jgi:opacity protein-like surface antigen